MKEPIRKLSTDIIKLTCFLFALTAFLSACSSSPTALPSKSYPVPTSTSIATDQRPIEIVTLSGPMPPVNPAGPEFELSLKNISLAPIVTLNATLELNRPYGFSFDVSLPVPILPGRTIKSERTVISAGFDASTTYPLKIQGTFQNGSTFEYILKVQIKPYPTTNS
jgi:hypothetical protein